MSDAILTLEILADACGASATDLRIGPLAATNLPVVTRRTPFSLTQAPSAPSSVSLGPFINGFGSPVDDGECANLLRFSRVVIEKSSRSSLDLLQLPEPLENLAFQSLELVTQDCAALGEQVR